MKGKVDRKPFFIRLIRLPAAVLALAVLAACGQGGADSASGKGEVNVYSARHYDVDGRLFEAFTEQTGIRVNVIEGKAEELIERIKREGDSTPADLFITVDGGILNEAKKAGILQPVESAKVLEQVPADFRDADNHWIGLSTRARVIVYAKDRVDPAELSTYEDLAEAKWKGKVLVRSSTNMYNQSLVASFIALHGEAATLQWAEGIVANMAREPSGGDRDQAKAVAAGEGDVAIMNSYYVGQLAHSEDAEERKVAEAVGVFFPNQETTGTHLNISGAGLIKASKNKENAVRLIEFLTGVEAQERFSAENYEFPVNPAAKAHALLESWGSFRKQDIDWAVLGDHNRAAVEIMNKAGWK